MVGKIYSGKHFRGLITYITQPEKEAWREGRHLPELDRGTVIKDMEFVAGLSERVQDPVYHVSVSWSPKDNPSKEDQLEVADRVIEALGMKTNQALIVSHRDTDHPHIHLAINRVDLEQFKAVDRWKHQMTLRKTLRQIEHEKGWAITAEAGKGDPDRAKTDWQAKHCVKVNEAIAGLGIGDPDYQTVRERALEAREDLYKQAGWQGFDHTLAQKGLWVEKRGNGMVITDGAIHMKASSLARDFSRGKLEKKFDQPLDHYLQRRELTISVEKGVATVADWTMAVNRIELESATIGAKKALESMKTEAYRIDKFDTMLHAIKQKIDKGFEHTFASAEDAKRDFSIIVDRDGLAEAHAELEANPWRFGRVKNDGELVKLSGDIRDMEEIYNNWRNYLEDKIIDDSKARAALRERLRERSADLPKTLPMLKRELAKAMQQSEAGYTMNRTAEEVIAVSRAISAMMKNFQPLVNKVGGRGVAAFKKDLVKQSEAGKELVEMGDRAVQATQLVLKLGAALHAGGMSMVQSGIRHAVHQHRQNTVQKQLEREVQRGDFSR